MDDETGFGTDFHLQDNGAGDADIYGTACAPTTSVIVTGPTLFRPYGTSVPSAPI